MSGLRHFFRGRSTVASSGDINDVLAEVHATELFDFRFDSFVMVAFDLHEPCAAGNLDDKGVILDFDGRGGGSDGVPHEGGPVFLQIEEDEFLGVEGVLDEFFKWLADVDGMWLVDGHFGVGSFSAIPFVEEGLDFSEAAAAGASFF